ncbi:MAG: hypothetical protein KC910_32545 [Candidatus Eremiobacteraeota bacterium]|nr:hypothetical protein [Candidatus Eremiobacteraeota bacterium]
MFANFTGWLLCFAALGIPFASRRIRHDPALARVTVFSLAVHQLVSFLQVFFKPLPTVDADAVAFNTYALGRGAEALEHVGYAEFLRDLYHVVAGSHLLGCQLSNLAFAISLVAFVELLVVLEREAHAPALMVMFACLPSCVLNTSVVLREAWQICCFLILLLAVVHYRRFDVSGLTLAGFASSLVLVFLHNVFPVIVAGVLGIGYFWASQPHRSKQAVRGGMVLCSLMLLPIVLPRLVERSAVVRMIQSGKILQYADNYQEGVNEGRSSFRARLDLSSPGRFLLSAPGLYATYLFAPFPWDIRGPKDLAGLLECFFRLCLFGSILLSLRDRCLPQRECALFLFVVFLVVEALWSTGTTNWGTAFRHRLVAYPIMVALGGPYLLARLADADGARELRARRARRLQPETA